MKYKSTILSSLLIIILIIISCTDTSTKFEEFIGDVRVEYSSCSGCLECIEEFSCPQNAIKIDDRTHRTYIDQNDCVSCMKCISNFNCKIPISVFPVTCIPCIGKISTIYCTID